MKDFFKIKVWEFRLFFKAWIRWKDARYAYVTATMSSKEFADEILAGDIDEMEIILVEESYRS